MVEVVEVVGKRRQRWWQRWRRRRRRWSGRWRRRHQAGDALELGVRLLAWLDEPLDLRLREGRAVGEVTAAARALARVEVAAAAEAMAEDVIGGGGGGGGGDTCVNSRVRISPPRGAISLRNALPTCAAEEVGISGHTVERKERGRGARAPATAHLRDAERHLAGVPGGRKWGILVFGAAWAEALRPPHLSKPPSPRSGLRRRAPSLQLFRGGRGRPSETAIATGRRAARGRT